MYGMNMYVDMVCVLWCIVEIREQFYVIDSLLTPYRGSGIEFRSSDVPWKPFELLRHLTHRDLLHPWSFLANIRQVLSSNLLRIHLATGRSPVSSATLGSFLVLLPCFLMFLSLVSFLCSRGFRSFLPFPRENVSIWQKQLSGNLTSVLYTFME